MKISKLKKNERYAFFNKTTVENAHRKQAVKQMKAVARDVARTLTPRIT